MTHSWSSYVLVATDPVDMVIRAGPFLLDLPSTPTPAADEQVMTEADALASGHIFPDVPVSVSNAVLLRDQARQALDANAAYLALDPPTQAQVVAQVNRLTRECSALIRLLLLDTRSIAGT